jgi:hypothetical protein
MFRVTDGLCVTSSIVSLNFPSRTLAEERHGKDIRNKGIAAK